VIPRRNAELPGSAGTQPGPRTTLALTLLLVLPQESRDPAPDLFSKDPELRLAAVRTLAEQGHPDAEKLLLKALKDDDWEIVAIAASELGELASKKALYALLELALEGPTRGLRRSAAEALRAIDAPAAGAELSRKLSGAHAEAACEALASLAPALDGTVKTAPLQKLVQGKESAPRAAAAHALVTLAGEARAAELAALLAHEDLAVRALALEGAGAAADPATLAALLELLGQAGLQDVLERRTAGALRAICGAHPQRSEELLSGLARVGGPGRARVARVLGRLGGEHEGKRALEPARALVALEPLLSDGASDVRAAGAAALGRVGTEEALARAEPLARSDAAARVRAAALDVLVGRRTRRPAPCWRRSCARTPTRACARRPPWPWACAGCSRHARRS
jgi:HEAT repeat protein